MSHIRTVIVTGSSGYVGAAIVRALLSRRDLRVLGIDRVAGDVRSKRFSEINIDLADPDCLVLLRNLGAEVGGSAVLHFAGLYVKNVERGREMEASPFQRDNVTATRYLVDALLAWNTPPSLFLYSSTACLYDGAEISPTPVEVVRPVFPYGESKWQGEAEARRLVGVAQRVFVSRFSRIVGLAGHAALQEDIVSDFFAKFSDADRRCAPTWVRGSREVRCYIHIQDVVDVLIELLQSVEKDLPNVFNMTSSKPVSVEAIARIVASEMSLSGLLSGDPRLKFDSERTRVPVLVPEVFGRLGPSKQTSEAIVERAAAEYCRLNVRMRHGGRIEIPTPVTM